MRIMAIVKATKDTEAGVMPTTADMAEMGQFNEELVKAGIMLAGDGLSASKDGARIYYDGSKRTVVDGPFAEAKELIAGYWIWQVKSMEEAVEWAKRIPFKDGQVELRRAFEAEDFGEAFTPELQEHDARLRNQLTSQQ
ncbi:MAG: YciI family protein [Caldilineaceae bacterium]